MSQKNRIRLGWVLTFGQLPLVIFFNRLLLNNINNVFLEAIIWVLSGLFMLYYVLIVLYCADSNVAMKSYYFLLKNCCISCIYSDNCSDTKKGFIICERKNKKTHHSNACFNVCENHEHYKIVHKIEKQKKKDEHQSKINEFELKHAKNPKQIIKTVKKKSISKDHDIFKNDLILLRNISLNMNQNDLVREIDKILNTINNHNRTLYSHRYEHYHYYIKVLIHLLKGYEFRSKDFKEKINESISDTLPVFEKMEKELRSFECESFDLNIEIDVLKQKLTLDGFMKNDFYKEKGE